MIDVGEAQSTVVYCVAPQKVVLERIREQAKQAVENKVLINTPL